MENKVIKYLILGFVFLIIGIALLPSIATITNEATSKTLVVGETKDITTAFNTSFAQINESDSDSNFTIANYPTNWQVLECPITSFSLQNDTTVYTLNTDYNFYPASGLVSMLNTTTTDGNNDTGALNENLFLRYEYCSNDYLDSDWGRTVINLVPGFLALALLGGELWMFCQVFKETGFIN